MGRNFGAVRFGTLAPLALCGCSHENYYPGRWSSFAAGGGFISYLNRDSIDQAKVPNVLDTITVQMARDSKFKLTPILQVRREDVAIWCATHEIAILSSHSGKVGEELKSTPPRAEYHVRHSIEIHTIAPGTRHGGYNRFAYLWYAACSPGSTHRETHDDPVAHFKSVSKTYERVS